MELLGCRLGHAERINIIRVARSMLYRHDTGISEDRKFARMHPGACLAVKTDGDREPCPRRFER